MEKSKKEQVVYLQDLLFVLLHGWRSLLIAAMLFAVALGGIKLVSGISDIEGKNIAAKAALQAAKEQYSRDVEVASQAIISAEKKRDDQKSYMEESLYLRLNPEAFYQAEIICYVKCDSAENSENARRILNQYVSVVQSSVVLTRLGASAETEVRYLREVFSVTSDAETLRFHVICSSDTEEKAGKLLSGIKKEITDAQEKIAQINAEHELFVFEECVTKQKSAELAEKQRKAAALLDSLNAKVDNAKAAKNAIAEPVAEKIPMSQSIGPAMKYAVVGAVIGIAAVMAYLWLAHIFGSRVYSARVLNHVTGVKLLGCIAGQEARNPIDRWLLALEGRQTEVWEERIKFLAADIRNRCGESKQLLITGDGDNQCRKQLAQALANELTGIYMVEKGSILRDPAAVEALPACDAVLLIEQCGSSSYGQIEREMDTVADYGKTMIGCVLLDG